MTTTEPTDAAAMMATDDPPYMSHDLARRLLAGPDLPVVIAIDGPDPDVASPADWVDNMWYEPGSPGHGRVYEPEYDPTDENGEVPGAVRVVAIGQRGLPDEAWAEWARTARGGLAREDRQ